MQHRWIGPKESRAGIKVLIYGSFILFVLNFLFRWASPDSPWDSALVLAANDTFFIALVTFLLLATVHYIFRKK